MSQAHKRVRYATTNLSDKQKIEKIISDITAEYQAATTQLSTQSRSIALSILAVAWLLLTEDSLSNRFGGFTAPLLTIAACCVISLAADFLQYCFIVSETRLALEDSHEATTVDEAGYDDPSWLRRGSTACFWLKLVASLVGAVYLVLVIYKGMVP